MAESSGKIGPWSSVDVAIEGEPLAKDGLRKRREQLEIIVEPLLDTARRKGNSDCDILYKGKRRYLKNCPLFLPGKDREAVFALQHLYAIEAAWKAGDIDKVVRATFGFATEENRRSLLEMTGEDGTNAAFSVASRKRKISARRQQQVTLPTAELTVVFKFIATRVKAGDTQAGASQQASAHLSKGTLHNLPRVRAISAKRLANLYSERNKKPSRQ